MILTVEKLKSIKTFSTNNLNLLNQLIDEVEFGKIQKLLGFEIYSQINAAVQSGNIDTELEEILEIGLYRAITYYVYARYVQESMLQDTFSGMRTKVMNESQPASTGALKNVAAEYNDMAYLAYSMVAEKINKKYGNHINASDTNEYSIEGVRKGTRYRRGKDILFSYFE